MRTLALLATLAVLSASSVAAETRCGWIDNPSPANWWLTDADRSWTLMTQGAQESGVPGMELIPDLTLGEWVRTNGYHGYGCACLEVTTQGDRVLAIHGARQLALAACEADPALASSRP